MVKIVTDSVADLPDGVSKMLDITVIPLLLRFGTEEFRDRVDLTSEQFYRRLQTSSEFPTTAMPSPATFAQAYDSLSERADAVLVITISSELSGTFDSARSGRELMSCRMPVEVLDSQTATMAEGFIAMKAAEAANAGASLQEATEEAKRARSRVDFLCTFDTLEYLKRGGRIGAASAFLGSVLKVNPLIAIRDGALAPAGRTRSRTKAVDCLVQFVADYSVVEKLSVESTDCPEEAEALVARLREQFPHEILRSNMTPVIGAHTGPGLLLVSVLGDRK